MMEWLDAKTFRLGDATFRLETGKRSADSDVPFDFLLRKVRSHLDRYLALVDEFGHGNVFELGINFGGSTAAFAELLQPEKMVAVDIDTARLDDLDRFLERRGLANRVLPFYGVDQADVATLTSLCDAHFDGPLDLVIDDASHLPHETRVTFNTMFPRVRPGGVYILEDWSAAMAMERAISQMDGDKLAALMAAADPQDAAPPKPQMGFARFVLELVLASGSAPDVVADVVVSRGIALLRRGTAEIDPKGFDIADHYFQTGRAALGSP